MAAGIRHIETLLPHHTQLKVFQQATEVAAIGTADLRVFQQATEVAAIGTADLRVFQIAAEVATLSIYAGVDFPTIPPNQAISVSATR